MEEEDKEKRPAGSPWRIKGSEELEKHPELKREDLDTIRNWITSQKHLPQNVDDEMILHFLHACYFNVSNTKATMELFYSYRSAMTEFFTDWDPLSKETQEIVNNILIAAPLPSTDNEGNRVIVCKLNDTNPANFNYPICVKWLLITAQVAQWELGIQNGYIIVYDATGYSMSHLFKCSLSTIKNYINWGKHAELIPNCAVTPTQQLPTEEHGETAQNRFISQDEFSERGMRALRNASPIRVLRVVFINTSSVVKKMLTLVRPFLNKELLQMMKFYTDADGYFESMSKENIPEDYGGTAPPLLTLHREYMKTIVGHRQHLVEEEKMKSDENKREGKKKKDIKQAEKSFNTLEID